MEIKIYFSPNMDGMQDFQSYNIKSPQEVLNILPQAWEELSSLYEVEEGSSEAFILAYITGKSPIEITCASFSFSDGQLNIQFPEFYEPDQDALNWQKIGLSIDKEYIGEDGLKEILTMVFNYQNKSK